MKQVVRVSTHFRETDQLKLQMSEHAFQEGRVRLFVRVFGIVRPIPVHNLYIFALLWVAAFCGGKCVAVCF
jgi:hypothetical protein